MGGRAQRLPPRCIADNDDGGNLKKKLEGVGLLEAWCFSSLEKVFFQHPELCQHPKGIFSAPGVFSASKLDFFQHPKGIFSTSQVSSASRRGLKDLIGLVVLVAIVGIVLKVVL